MLASFKQQHRRRAYMLILGMKMHNNLSHVMDVCNCGPAFELHGRQAACSAAPVRMTCLAPAHFFEALASLAHSNLCTPRAALWHSREQYLATIHWPQVLTGIDISAALFAVVHAAWLHPTCGSESLMRSKSRAAARSGTASSRPAGACDGPGRASSRASSCLSWPGSPALAPACSRRAKSIGSGWLGGSPQHFLEGLCRLCAAQPRDGQAPARRRTLAAPLNNQCLAT